MGLSGSASDGFDRRRPGTSSIRLQLVDVLRQRVGKVCVWEFVPLFDVAQPTVSHHPKVLRDAGLVDSERRGPWVDYYVRPDALDELSGWLR
jgi:ArsR family transcriptional regulator, arsenate/arsenite/antimonite-responsive transcriptional repressor